MIHRIASGKCSCIVRIRDRSFFMRGAGLVGFGGGALKSYDDYHWATLCEDAAKLKKTPCARIEQILTTSWAIKTASEEQQE